MDIIMANIERYREVAGMTKEEFTKKLGISCSKYERYLAEEAHIITKEVFQAANILHVKVSDILMPRLD